MFLMKKQETTRAYDEQKKTTCGNCPAGCGLKLFLHQGKVVDIFGDEEHPINKGSICPKGLLTHFHLDNPKRIVTPGIRKSTSEDFTHVSWNDAIDYTRSELEKIIERYGKESIALHGNESDPFAYLTGAAWFGHEMGITVHTPETFLGPGYRSGSKVEKMFGIPESHLLTNHPRDWCNSKCIVVYSSDLSRSDPITFGPIVDARDRGSALIVIDHHPTRTSAMASTPVIVKPGTQSILLKGVIRYLIDRNMVDHDFIRRNTTGSDTLISELRPYTIEHVAETCRIEAGQVTGLGDRIGKLWPVQIIAGDWHSRNYLEEEDFYACAVLACLRGSIGVPGGGLNFLAASPLWIRRSKPEGADSNDQGGTLDSLGKAKAVICYGNPFGTRAGVCKPKEAMSEADPLVVQLSVYPDTTYQRARISMPMSSWVEYDSVYWRSNSRAIQAHRKVVDPPGDCKSPLEFWTAMACAMKATTGPPWVSPGGGVNHIEAADYFLHRSPLTKRISFSQIDPVVQKPGGVLWPCIEPADLEFETNRSIRGTVRGRNILFLHGQNYPGSTSRFPTRSGRIEFQPMAAPDIDGVTRYPLFLVMGVHVDFVQGFGHFVNDETRPAPRPLFKIHRALAAAAGITNGDIVTVKNDLGTVTGPVQTASDVDPCVIWCPEGVEPCQPGYPYENPQTLFGVQERHAFARVILFKDPEDEARMRERITGMGISPQRHSEAAPS